MIRDNHPLPVINAATPDERGQTPVVAAPRDGPSARVRKMVDDHYDAVWRSLRFFGVPDEAAEDFAQQVFCVAARKLQEILPGAERSFLLSTAWRAAAESRRAARRRPAVSEGDVEALEAPLPSPEQLLDTKRARAVLQSVLAAMDPDLRVIFVLYGIEELTLPEVAAAIGIPLGTATSRLRRARDAFQRIVRRRNAAVNVPPRGSRP